MSRIPIQIVDSCTFADYFKLPYDTEDVVAYFGYALQMTSLTLPHATGELDRLQDLRDRIPQQRSTPKPLTSGI